MVFNKVVNQLIIELCIVKVRCGFLIQLYINIKFEAYI